MRLGEKIAEAGDNHPYIIALVIIVLFGLGSYLISVIYMNGLEWIYSLFHHQ